jgi:hypothetical protein
MRAYASGLVAGGLLLLCGAASAADYGDNLGEPNTLFGGGTTRYDAASGLFTIEATPLSTRLTPGAPRVAIEPPSSLTIQARIDASSGTVLGGAFSMTGDVDDYGSGGQVEYSGTLLTGDIIELSYFDLSSTDVFVFRFTVTGGALAPRYAGHEIGVAVTVDHSTFSGSFDRSFKGGASGHVGISVPVEFVCADPSSITANFDGTPIPAGRTIWFNSVLKVSGLQSEPVKIQFQHAMIDSADGQISVPVPDAEVTFSPTGTTASTTFNGTTWVTTVPTGLPGNTFFAGVEFPVPSPLPGGIKNVTWSGRIVSDTPGVTVQWQWAAAVYSAFSDLESLGVKPVDDNKASVYLNSDHAGTPESVRQFVVSGARGGGGANFTGSYSGTVKTGACQ